MPDDVTANPGSGGPRFKTDEDTNSPPRHWPYIKLAFGADNTQTRVTNTVGLPIAPFAAIIETGLTQIIGINDAAMTQNEYSSTATLSLGGTYSGEILGFTLSSLTSDASSPITGAVQEGTGTVYFFDATPATTSGDTALAAAGAEHNTVIGIIKIAAADWDSDASGAVVHKTVAIPFHALANIYCVYRTTDSVATWNSAAGDDERLNINMWFRRDS